MYCPKCGAADQKANSYCRKCGEFLPDLEKRSNFEFGGTTPEEQINTNLFLNLLSAIVSFALAIALYATFWKRGDTLPVIYIVAAFLLAMSAWQTSTFVVGLKLKRNFNKRKSPSIGAAPEKEKVNSFESARTKILLDEANLENVVPASVVENTTKLLGDKVALPQTEQKTD